MTFSFYNRLVNPVVRAILRSPVHGLLSRSLMLLTYTGRKSGRRITIPVTYAEAGDEILVLVGRPERKRWWRNLRGGAPVSVRLRGDTREGFAETVTGDTERVSAGLRVYLAKFRRVGKACPSPGGTVMVRVRQRR